MKLTQKMASKVHRVLIYGPPKTGKTQLAGALSQYKNLIWFDLENGYSTLLKFPDSWKEKIEIISIPDTRSFPIAIETCLKVIKGGPVEICEQHGKVGCPICKKDSLPFTKVELNSLGEDTVVVFDSLTQLTASAIAHITKGQPDDYKLDYSDWGNLGKLMEIFLSHIQQANYNVVCISHETEAELEDGKTKLVPVAGTRAFSRNTAKYFDHVVYAEVKNKKHNFYSTTTSAANLNTGSRTGIALETITDSPLITMFRDPPTQNIQVTQKQESSDKLKSILSSIKKA
jgi:DNA polymerase III delta prime subunit